MPSRLSRAPDPRSGSGIEIARGRPVLGRGRDPAERIVGVGRGVGRARREGAGACDRGDRGQQIAGRSVGPGELAPRWIERVDEALLAAVVIEAEVIRPARIGPGLIGRVGVRIGRARVGDRATRVGGRERAAEIVVCGAVAAGPSRRSTRPDRYSGSGLSPGGGSGSPFRGGATHPGPAVITMWSVRPEARVELGWRQSSFPKVHQVLPSSSGRRPEIPIPTGEGNPAIERHVLQVFEEPNGQQLHGLLSPPARARSTESRTDPTSSNLEDSSESHTALANHPMSLYGSSPTGEEVSACSSQRH